MRPTGRWSTAFAPTPIDDDRGRQAGNVVGPVPSVKPSGSVRPNDQKPRGLMELAEGFQGLGAVGRSVPLNFDGTHLEPLDAVDSGSGHRQAGLGRRDVGLRCLLPGVPRHDKKDRVKIQGVPNLECGGQMTEMRGIKGPAEDTDATHEA